MAEQEDNEPKIVVSKNGPYVVKGNVPLSIQVIAPNKEGFSWEWKEAKEFETPSGGYALCRCGHSSHKPFCNGSHASIKFRDGLFEDAK
jgi:CDGSH-type Zn-finger protein